MSKKMSACLYIDKGVLETARNAGLNLSRVAENALVEAIWRLTGQKLGTSLDSRAPVIVLCIGTYFGGKLLGLTFPKLPTVSA